MLEEGFMIRNARYLAAYVVILTMALHALIPAGWMPNPGGGAAFTICTMDGLQKIAPSQKSDRHHSSSDNSICPFAAAAHFATPARVPVLVPRQAEFTRTQIAFSSSTVLTAARDWSRAPRAPPAYS